ncbi:MAG: hypothetical protein SGI87_11930 [Flavobacteriales bacterium]|nr:hypothetical protein [Flavobacteriales bacterium]
MKKIFAFSWIVMSTIGSGKAQSETVDSLGLSGDHLSLFGVLEVFKNSGSVEEFEKKLNAEDSNINNLDLDSNGEVDYIIVNDVVEESAHAFMLSVQVAEDDIRDVACVAIEKKGNEEAVIQVIGDEDFYGSNYFVEPSDEMKSGGKGSCMSMVLYVNVWMWPCVMHIYRPAYVVWVSPWSWHVHPQWWRPWHPWSWNRWHPACDRYTRLHVRTRTCHVVQAQNVYYGHRQAKAKNRSINSGSGRTDERKTGDRAVEKRPNSESPKAKNRQQSSGNSGKPNEGKTVSPGKDRSSPSKAGTGGSGKSSPSERSGSKGRK